jgi:hypothetical protein
MSNSKYRLHIFKLILLACSVLLLSNASAQTLQERLKQQTDFVPHSVSPDEQLIEIAQRFKIPLAIEWLEQANEQPAPALVFDKGSVLDLIRAVVRRAPEQQLIVKDRILYISAPTVVSHPFNFLNLRIENYSVKDESLFGAEFELRMGINMMLYPELFKNGYDGGYGGGTPHVFWKKNINVSGERLTIREILTKIAVASGNALWIVRLKPDEFTGNKPKWLGVPIDEYGHSPLNTRWRFIPLSEEESNNSIKD